MKAKIISYTNNKYLCSCNFSINCGFPRSHSSAFIIKKNIFDVKILPYNKRCLIEISNNINYNRSLPDTKKIIVIDLKKK